MLTISAYAAATCGDATSVCGVAHCKFESDSTSYKSTTIFNESTVIVSGYFSDEKYITVENNPIDNNCMENTEESENFVSKTECVNGREIHTVTLAQDAKTQFQQDLQEIRAYCKGIDNKLIEEEIESTDN